MTRFSKCDVHLEALFEDTNNFCVCSRAELKDFYRLPEDFEDDANFLDDLEDKQEDSEDEPDLPFEGEYEADLELMKTMGLPVSFGSKKRNRKKLKAKNCFYDNSYNDFEKEHEYYDNDDSQYYDNDDSQYYDNDYSSQYHDNDYSSQYYDYNSQYDTNFYDCDPNVDYYNEDSNEIETVWKDYWSLHGETIIMNSWMQKYKKFINPDYFKQNGDEFLNVDNVSPTERKNIPSDLNQVNDRFQSMSFTDYVNSNDENMLEKDIIAKDSDKLDSDLKNNSGLKLEKEISSEQNSYDSIAVEDNSKKNMADSSKTCASDQLNGFIGCDLDSQKFLERCNTTEKKVYNNMFTCKVPLTDDCILPIVPSNDATWDELWNLHAEEQHDLHYDLFKQSYLSKNSGLNSEKYELREDRNSELYKCYFCGKYDCNFGSSDHFTENYNSDLLNVISDIPKCCDTLSGNMNESISLESSTFMESTILNSFENVDGTVLCKSSGQSEDLVESCSINLLKTEDIDSKNSGWSESANKSESNIQGENKLPENVLSDDPVKPDYILLENVVSSEQISMSNESSSVLKNCDNSSDEGPSELPIRIKRIHDSDSDGSMETPTDHIKNLGLVIKPNDTLKIKKRNRRRRQFKRFGKSKCPFSMVTSKNNLLEKNFQMQSSEKATNSENGDVAIGCSKKDAKPNALQMPVLNKYWVQRYRLFYRFDEGIQLDEESWFSVTPERIARHIAERCACDVIIDAFCGAGGNAIQFALACNHVIAIDIDPKKVEMAQHNAKVYGVDDKIDFIVGDYFDVVPSLKADAIFLSPRWGGPQYLENEEFDISSIDPDIYKTYEVARKITNNIAIFVPRNTIINQLVQLAGDGNHVEIEQNVLNKKVKTLTAYYGDLVQQDSSNHSVNQTH